MSHDVDYLDDGSQPNAGRSGFSVLLLPPKRHKEIIGGFRLASNRQMEIYAAFAGRAVFRLERMCCGGSTQILWSRATDSGRGITRHPDYKLRQQRIVQRQLELLRTILGKEFIGPGPGENLMKANHRLARPMILRMSMKHHGQIIFHDDQVHGGTQKVFGERLPAIGGVQRELELVGAPNPQWFSGGETELVS